MKSRSVEPLSLSGQTGRAELFGLVTVLLDTIAPATSLAAGGLDPAPRLAAEDARDSPLAALPRSSFVRRRRRLAGQLLVMFAALCNTAIWLAMSPGTAVPFSMAGLSIGPQCLAPMDGRQLGYEAPSPLDKFMRPRLG